MMVDEEGTLADFVRPSIPIVCIPEDAGTDVGLDVVFMIDQSGSMSSNDGSGLRIEAAKRFVEQMRDQDRAGVVSFTSSATRRAPLTLLEDQTARTSVEAAIEAARRPGGSTSISAPMREMLDVYDDAPQLDGARTWLAILLTDGVGSYDTSLTRQAAEDNVIVYTIGLGSGVDADLLRGIAEGTNGRFEQLQSADQLVPIFEEIIGALFDDGTDSDGDGLTDCEETNGMLSGLALLDDDEGYPLFYFGDPDEPDSDFDGIPDNFSPDNPDDPFDPGAKWYEVLRITIEPDDDGWIAREYPYLVEAGVRSYFLVRSDPLDQDSDGDSFFDPEDPERLNPYVPAIPDLPFDVPFTELYQPVEYGDPPALDERFVVKPVGGTELARLVTHRSTVLYDEDFNCVARCDDVQAWAEEEPDGGGFPCFFGIGGCDDDASQAREAIKQIVTAQGVFDDEGINASDDFLVEQGQAWCLVLYEDCDIDGVADIAESLALPPTRPLEIHRVEGTRVAGRTGTQQGLRAAAGVVSAVVAAVLLEIALDRDASPQGASEENLRVGMRACLQSPLLGTIGFRNGLHSCEFLDLYFPGPNLDRAFALRAAAVGDTPAFHLQSYLPEDQRDDTLPRTWYDSEPECDATARQNAPAGDDACDEFPNYQTAQAGRVAPPLAVLELIPTVDNSREGAFFGNFVGDRFPWGCDLDSGEPFGVVPLPADGPSVTFHVCAPG
jgi:Mg-chelatase subunit ChlD